MTYRGLSQGFLLASSFRDYSWCNFRDFMRYQSLNLVWSHVRQVPCPLYYLSDSCYFKKRITTTLILFICLLFIGFNWPSGVHGLFLCSGVTPDYTAFWMNQESPQPGKWLYLCTIIPLALYFFYILMIWNKRSKNHTFSKKLLVLLVFHLSSNWPCLSGCLKPKISEDMLVG